MSGGRYCKLGNVKFLVVFEERVMLGVGEVGLSWYVGVGTDYWWMRAMLSPEWSE